MKINWKKVGKKMKGFIIKTPETSKPTMAFGLGGLIGGHLGKKILRKRRKK